MISVWFPYKRGCLYLRLQSRLVEHVRALLRRMYDIELSAIGVSQPPSAQFGEYALTFAFELAKQLRKPPRVIANEIVAAIGDVPGFERFEVAGGGYINARVDRAEMA